MAEAEEANPEIRAIGLEGIPMPGETRADVTRPVEDDSRLNGLARWQVEDWPKPVSSEPAGLPPDEQPDPQR